MQEDTLVSLGKAGARQFVADYRKLAEEPK
jgi:hypothetical protein